MFERLNKGTVDPWNQSSSYRMTEPYDVHHHGNYAFKLFGRRKWGACAEVITVTLPPDDVHSSGNLNKASNNSGAKISFPVGYYRPQTMFAKVMFLQVSVSHSVHRGEGVRGRGMHGGGGGMCGRERGGVGGVHGVGGGMHACIPPADTIATAYSEWAGGTHPTGMHSCYTGFHSDWKIRQNMGKVREFQKNVIIIFSDI